MNVAYLFDIYPQEYQTSLQREMDALHGAGIEVEIWAMQANSLARPIPTPKRRGFKKYFYTSQHYHDTGIELSKHLQKIGHIHATNAGIMAQIAMAAAAKRRLSWSFRIDSQDLEHLEDEMLALLMESASFVVAATRQILRNVRKRMPHYATKVLLAPLGLPLDEYPFINHQRFFPPLRILAAGQLREDKGFAHLFRAMDVLRRRDTYPQITVVGNGSYRRDLEKMVSVFQLTHLYFEGYLPPPKVRAHMQRATVLIAPYTHDKNGIRSQPPNTILEAAAVGLPILTTPASDSSGFINEESAWIFAPNDAEAIVQVLEEALASPQVAFHKVSVARRLVEEHYDIELNIRPLARAFRNSSMERARHRTP